MLQGVVGECWGSKSFVLCLLDVLGRSLMFVSSHLYFMSVTAYDFIMYWRETHPSCLIERVVKLCFHGDLAVGMRVHERQPQVWMITTPVKRKDSDHLILITHRSPLTLLSALHLHTEKKTKQFNALTSRWRSNTDEWYCSFHVIWPDQCFHSVCMNMTACTVRCLYYSPCDVDVSPSH